MTDKQIDALQTALTALEVYEMTGDAAMVRATDAALRELAEIEVQRHVTSATARA